MGPSERDPGLHHPPTKNADEAGASEASEIARLESAIRHHNRLYWDQDAPEISDTDYDLLVRRLQALSPNSEVLLEMGPTTERTIGAKHRHLAAMLSLDKCYEVGELEEWAKSFTGKVVAMPKYDGVACALYYDEKGQLAVAATRGDGRVGEDITQNARVIRDIPGRIAASRHRLEVRGEIYMRLSVFEQFKAEGMANPRNLTAGAVKQKDTSKSASYRLSFAAYDLIGGDEVTVGERLARLTELGFAKIDAVVLAHDELGRGVEEFTRLRPSLDYEIDGVVFKADNLAEQRRLGETAHHPRYAIAYKFQGDAGLSHLRGVEWSVARTGAITPVALVDPVVLSGVTVSRASLHNAGYIDKLGLSLGAQVTLVRRGGVIPNVENVVVQGTEPVNLPHECPSCGSPVVRTKDFLYCTTPQNCRRAVIGQLGHFAGTLDMVGFGEAVLEQAFDRGLLRQPADFYTLRWEALAELERMAEKSAKKLVAEVDKKRNVDLATFLRALGLPELGKHVSSLLADRYRTLEAVRSVQEAELAATHGIGETIATQVVRGLTDAAPIIDALRAHVTITPPPGSGGETTGPFTGQSFVFTGKMVAFSRSEAEKRVRALGGAVLSAVSKNLTFLVVGADKTGPKSTKERAAEKLIADGLPLRILGEDELLAMLEKAQGA